MRFYDRRYLILREMQSCSSLLRIVFILLSTLVLSGCFNFFSAPSGSDIFPPLSDIPDAFIEIPPDPDQSDYRTVTTNALKITDGGLILGSVSGSNPPSYNPDLRYNVPKVFVIRADRTGYKDLTPQNAAAAWAGDINEAGVVVGTYLKNGQLHAFKINSDATGFADINPANNVKSIAKVILNSGIILGLADGIPCVLPIDGSQSTPLIPGYSNSYINCANEQYVVLTGSLQSGGAREIILYQLVSGSYSTLYIPDFPEGYFTVSEITGDNTILGWCESGQYNEHVAFAYHIGDSTAWYYGGPINRNGFEYSNFRFCDCTKSGKIIGRVFRLLIGSYGFPVQRAAVFSLGINGFTEVTPWDEDGYSRLNSVNETNWAVGDGAFSYGDEEGRYTGTIYRAFIVKIE